MKDEQCMHLTLSLARKGMGTTSPNPMVGAVLVKGNRIIGKGYHRKAGTPHAEVVALSEAKEEARGATLYVNLEPCVHTGRTPPCVNSIMAAGVRRIVVAMLDPNPQVNGKGINELKKAGIEVKVGLLEEEAKRLNEAFVVYMEKKRPFFTFSRLSITNPSIGVIMLPFVSKIPGTSISRSCSSIHHSPITIRWASES